MGRVKTTLPPDIEDEVEEYREEHDIAQAEAVRRLLIRGLDKDTRSDHILLVIASGLWIGAVVALALSMTPFGDYVPQAAVFGLASALFSTAYMWRGVVAKPWRERVLEVVGS